jgi:hypothetical protein
MKPNKEPHGRLCDFLNIFYGSFSPMTNLEEAEMCNKVANGFLWNLKTGRQMENKSGKYAHKTSYKNALEY